MATGTVKWFNAQTTFLIVPTQSVGTISNISGRTQIQMWQLTSSHNWPDWHLDKLGRMSSFHRCTVTGTH